MTGFACFVPGVPRPKGSMKTFIPTHGRKPIAIADNPRTKPWQDWITFSVKITANRRGLIPWSGPVGLRLLFTFEPGEFYKRDGNFNPVWYPKKPDLDKLARAVQDALTGILYKDDCQVCCLSVQKQYGLREGVSIEAHELNSEGPRVPQSPV